jgi:hypothetical protein
MPAVIPQSLRQVLILTLALSIGATAFVYFTTGEDWRSALLMFPIILTTSFGSFALSRRIAERFAPKPPGPPPPLEPSTERPEHAQRRRQRRRQRGGARRP